MEYDLGVLTSCVVTYHTLPESTEGDLRLPRTNLRLVYRPASEPSPPIREGVLPGIFMGHYPQVSVWNCNEPELMKELVQQGVVREAIVDSTLPEKGLYYSVGMTYDRLRTPMLV